MFCDFIQVYVFTTNHQITTLTAYPYRKQQISLSVCANAKADPDLCNNCRKMNNNNKV